MQNETKRPSTRRRGTGAKTTFKVSMAGHTMNLTADQLLADKSGWTHCHGQVGDNRVRSLSYKRIGDKTVVKNGHGKLAGCYDSNELAVMAKQFLSGFDQNSITIDSASA